MPSDENAQGFKTTYPAESDAPDLSTESYSIHDMGLGVVYREGESGKSELQTYYPPNSGFLSDPDVGALDVGYRFDRYGGYFDDYGVFHDFGTFAAPDGTPYGMRALPPGSDGKPLTTYEVVRKVPGVLSG